MPRMTVDTLVSKVFSFGAQNKVQALVSLVLVADRITCYTLYCCRSLLFVASLLGTPLLANLSHHNELFSLPGRNVEENST